MEMNIGTNIKRLRLAKGMTQEQLASLLSVSTAAVSKWEARNTYPDVTLLFPLAELFGVTIDELLGYDEAKAKADVDAILSEYRTLGVTGDFAAREKLIRQARKKYPHDFRVMVAYMRELAGGFAGNRAETLLTHKEELTQLADCILNGCLNDDLRSHAIQMKAKLLHAEGDTEGALALLDTLPAQPTRFLKEQLFGKDTPEFRFWNRKNCYGLLDVTAMKHARTVQFDPTLSFETKIRLLEEIAAAYAKASETPKTEFFVIGEGAVLAILFTMLVTENGTETDVIRVCEKRFAALKKMDELAETDEVLQKLIAETYKTQGGILAWEIDRLETSAHPRLAELRESPAWREMLANYEN